MVKTWTIDEVSNNRTVNDKVIPLTDAERQQLVIDWNNAEQKKSDDKIVDIRNIRNQKLSETDYLANSDITMPANIKTWRQTLRDIPLENIIAICI